jgi:hypothetical protein
MIDDIRLQAHFCLTAAYSANTAHESLQSDHPNSAYNFEQSDGNTNAVSDKRAFFSPDSNVCRLLSCNFNSNHMCLYESHRVASGERI